MKLSMRTLIVTSLVAIGVSGCSSSQNAVSPSKSITSVMPSGSLIYASYSEGNYSLYALDPKDYSVKKKVDLTKGWGDSITKDEQNQIWCPIYYQPDMTNFDNHVEVYNPQNGDTKKIQVGFGPKQVFTTEQGAYVVCEEDGNNPTIYFVDHDFKVKNFTTVKDGGLIAGATCDGKNIYFNSLHIDPSLDANKGYPMLIKVSLDNGTATKTNLADKETGLSNLKYVNGVVYSGYENTEGTVVAFDANSMHKVKALPYHDMVGDIMDIGDHKIAITNYSKLQQSGSKLTIVDTNSYKVVQQLETKDLVEHVSYVNGTYFSVDNTNSKLEILDRDGKVKKELDIPTQVTNFVSI